MIESHFTPPEFQPQILIYYCSHCNGPKCSGGLDLGSVSDNVSSLHFCCAREVTTECLDSGFRNGADGILICGCLVRDCSNSANDLQVLRGLYRNQLATKRLGLISDRLREEWVVQGTTDHLAGLIEEFVDQLRAFGPARVGAEVHPPLKQGESHG